MTMSGWVFASYAFGQMIFSPIAGKYVSIVLKKYIFFHFLSSLIFPLTLMNVCLFSMNILKYNML